MYDAMYREISEGIRKRINDPDDLNKFADYLERLDSFGDIVLENIDPHIQDGDHLYWYEFEANDDGDIYRESGVLVVRGKTIVHKYVDHTLGVSANGLPVGTVLKERR